MSSNGVPSAQRHQIHPLKSKVTARDLEIAHLKDRVRAMRDEEAEKDEELRSVRSQVDAGYEIIGDIRETYNTLNKDYDDLKEIVNRLETLCELKDRSISSRGEIIRMNEEEITEKENEVAEKENKIANNDKNYQSLLALQQRLNKSDDDVFAERDQLQESLKAHVEQSSKLTQEFQEQIAATQDQVDALKSRLINAEAPLQVEEPTVHTEMR